jgi:hypothetical protein
MNIENVPEKFSMQKAKSTTSPLVCHYKLGSEHKEKEEMSEIS